MVQWGFLLKTRNPTMRKTFLLLAFFASVAGFVRADEPAKSEKKPSRYELRQEHDPNGIGKFYMGREIAQVMGHQGANWLERPEREKEEHCSKLLPALKLKPGDY